MSRSRQETSRSRPDALTALAPTAEARRTPADILATVAREIYASLDLDVVFRSLTEAARELCRADLAWIALRDPESEAMLVRYSPGARADYTGLRIEPGAGMGGWVLATGRAFRTDDYVSDPRIGGEYMAVACAEGVRAAMVVPIPGDTSIQGLLYAENRSPRTFSGGDEALLACLADHAAIAIRNGQMFARERRARAQAEETGRVLDSILESMRHGVTLWDADSRLVAWNAEFLGLADPPREIIAAGLPATVLYRFFAERGDYGAGEPETLAARRASALESGRSLRFEVSRTDGTVIEMRENPTGRGGFVTTYTDISERSRLHRALRAIVEETSGKTGVELFGILVRELAVALGVRTTLIGERSDDETECLEVLAAWNGDGPGATGCIPIADSVAREVLDGSLRACRTGARERFPGDPLLAELDGFLAHPLASSSGSTIGLLLVGSETPLHHTPQTESLVRLFAARAGAELERQRADAALRASEAHYRTLVEGSLQGILIVGSGFIVEFANSAAAATLGFAEPAEVIGRDLRSLVKDEDVPALEASVAARFAGEAAPGRWELRYVRADGRQIWVDQLASLVSWRGGEGVLITQIETSEQKRLEDRLAQAEKMDALGRLAGGIAHDFNNLLTVIIGRAALCLRATDPQHPQRPSLELIAKTADRAAALTRQLLAFSRKQVLQRKTLDLNAAITAVLPMLRRLIGEDVALRFEPAAGSARIHADPGQIDQILLNLVANARDAMPRGGGLTIQTAEAQVDNPLPLATSVLPAGRYVTLRVEDTGTGMDEATRAHIFEPFFTTKGPADGTGLGLATVHGVVEQHGGGVTVESEPGRGTVFTIYLPRQEGIEEHVEPVPADHRGREGRGTVLLVEDDLGLRALVEEVLTTAGYAVLAARGVRDALEIAERADPHIDLLLFDVVMPEMSGPELAARVRASRPEARVLFISGYTGSALARHGISPEHVSFLPKPFSPADLTKQVAQELERP
jgi:PAS domain S-box-containing protein